MRRVWPSCTVSESRGRLDVSSTPCYPCLHQVEKLLRISHVTHPSSLATEGTQHSCDFTTPIKVGKHHPVKLAYFSLYISIKSRRNTAQPLSNICVMLLAQCLQSRINLTTLNVELHRYRSVIIGFVGDLETRSLLVYVLMGLAWCVSLV